MRPGAGAVDAINDVADAVFRAIIVDIDRAAAEDFRTNSDDSYISSRTSPRSDRSTPMRSV